MTQRIGEYLPEKVNRHVPDMSYSADIVHNGPNEFLIGTPVAADADGIVDGQSIATAGTLTAFESTYTASAMALYGRGVRIVSDGAATSDVTIKGRDFLGQPMMETLTLNGTTGVAGVKAFKTIESIEYEATASRTIDVGWTDVLGLPYATTSLLKELENSAAASAGTLVTRSLATQSATSADPRGTYDPSSACDGVTTFSLVMMFDRDNLHGLAHYYA